ncbi:hypothetical protein SXANM310S_03038 [Streptomyces xanthochromogenes]
MAGDRGRPPPNHFGRAMDRAGSPIGGRSPPETVYMPTTVADRAFVLRAAGTVARAVEKWKGVVVVLAWSERAMCGQGDADALFAEGTRQHDATALCMKCPVRTECLAHALDQRIEFGVWGGMTERERRALLRRRPGVASWRSLLETARTEHTHLARDRAPGPRREPGAAHQDTRGTSAPVYTPS